MTRLLLALAAVALLSASAPWHNLPAEYSRDPILQAPAAAADKTGAPERTIAGIRQAESSGRVAPRHPLASVRGSFGLDERYHSERARLYGEYDALDPYDAAYVTARLYCDHLAALRSEDLAITAHLYGLDGARRHGVASEYLARVRGGK